VADLEAAERNDQDYDHDEALFAVLRARKQQEPSMALLQLYAEAQAHDLPVMRQPNGQLIIGSGARGWSFDPAVLSLGLSVDVPWDSVGTVPVVAVTGPQATAVTRLIATMVERSGQRVGRADGDGVTLAGTQLTVAPSADFDGARHVLTDPQVDVAVVAVSPASILERGLGFDQCRVGVVTGIEATADDSAAVQDERAAAHGIVVLATEPAGTVVLNADDPQVMRLADWASGAQIHYSAHPMQQSLATDAVGMVYIDSATVHMIVNGQHTQVAWPNNQHAHAAMVTLPAVAAVRALGIDIATLA
jgi:UDP-N-acetylmuramyl tripeptide synthase